MPATPKTMAEILEPPQPPNTTKVEGLREMFIEILKPATAQTMPEGSEARKGVPLTTGVLDYFPAALAAVAKLSKFGNDKHNPGEPLHWSRGKSNDHADCIARHLVDRGVIDPETKMSHTVEVAWRALALLQEELEAAGAPPSRASKFPPNPGEIAERAYELARDMAQKTLPPRFGHNVWCDGKARAGEYCCDRAAAIAASVPGGP
jgi:hypothetical protein